MPSNTNDVPGSDAQKHLLILVPKIVSVMHIALELAHRLRMANYRITIGGAPAARSKAEQAGFAFVESELNFAPGSTGTQQGWGHWLKLYGIRQRLAESIPTERFYDQVTSITPDGLIIYTEMHTHIIASASLGIPVLLLDTFFLPIEQRDIPPLHTPIVPGVGKNGSTTSIRMVWLRFRRWKWTQQVRAFIRNKGLDQLSLLRAFAKYHKFPLTKNTVRWQWYIPYGYLHVPRIVSHAIELEFPHSPVAGRHYLGPLIRSLEQASVDEATLHVIQRCKEEGVKLIYCSKGTFFSDDSGLF